MVKYVDQWSPLVARSLGASLGLVVDRWVGEPPVAVHPVARFGQVMEKIEERWWKDDRMKGVSFASVGIGTGLAAGSALQLATSPMAEALVATAVASAGKALGEAAMTVATALDRGDFEAARAGLPALVGRDPTGFGEKEIARAVIESVAENTSDAVVAPALWATVAGAPGAFVHRSVNTLDAMVGYRSERYARFGWASARLDDVMAWPAARVTAALVALVRPRLAATVWGTVWRDAGRHPSPNAGVCEAAFAGALGIRLGGVNRYGETTEARSALGQGPPPLGPDIGRAVRLQRDVSLALAALLAVPAMASRRQRRGEGVRT
jgi:adenosylcobinamide-phosphate synthase